MAIGKREQIVGLVIATLGAVFCVHFFVFKKKADEFAEVNRNYTEGRTKLSSAEVPPPGNFMQRERAKTQAYKDQLTSLTANLNVGEDEKMKSDAMARYKHIEALLGTLVQMQQTVRQPRLTFLANNPDPSWPTRQLGWNFQPVLPGFTTAAGPQPAARAALWDKISALESRWNVGNTIGNPVDRMTYRQQYNGYMAQLGLPPAEIMPYVWPVGQANQYIFFDDEALMRILPPPQSTPNPWSINRYGVYLPELRKVWTLKLILDQQETPARYTIPQLYTMLEMKIVGGDLNYITKQLESLIDIIRIAERTKIDNIYSVAMLKPTDIGKVTRREPGKTPTPTPTPPPSAMSAFGGPMMGGGIGTPTPAPVVDKVGTGTGLEIYFQASNTALVDFLFEVGTVPKTYSVDDLHISVGASSVLNTSATIGFVTAIEGKK